MNDYSVQRKRRWHKVALTVVIVLALLVTGAAIAVRRVYQQNLQPISNSQKSQLVEVPVGSSAQQIAIKLEEAGLIRKSWAFEWYVRNSGNREKLQAGTYAIRPSQTVPEIVTALTRGRIATDLVTIYPAKRVDEIRDDLINQGFEAKAVDAALESSLYANHPALVDKPKEANLEGYIYPESFQKTAKTTPEEIIRQALDQMQTFLTPDVRAGFVRQGLTVHQGVTLASVVDQEVGHSVESRDLEDKKKVAQVFLRRIKEGKALESDATTDYGAIIKNETPRPDYPSPYNTYQNPGLPPGPISNVNKNSLLAVADPATTDFLFFVSGDDGSTHFSYTLEEHEALTRQYCKKLCQ